jgi:membrane protein Man1
MDALLYTVVAAALLLASVAAYYFVDMNKKRATADEATFYELVEKALELIQSPDEPRSMPVLHIRDTLITPQERKNSKLMKIWDRVVNFVESSDSRVKVEIENIEGEPFKTWKWVSSSASDGSSPTSNGNNVLRTGDIEWQGQAFSDINAEVRSGPRQSPRTSTENFIAPTPFLKVRHMFDAEAALIKPLTWKANVGDAILQKCSVNDDNSSHGIMHMMIDERDMAEGLVYMRCKDIPSASRVFTALHGWWCEKRLVSVRFLKEERYYSRFPEARNVIEPLRPQHSDVQFLEDDED